MKYITQRKASKTLPASSGRLNAIKDLPLKGEIHGETEISFCLPKGKSGGGTGLGGGSKLYTILHIKIGHQQNAGPNSLITCME